MIKAFFACVLCGVCLWFSRKCGEHLAESGGPLAAPAAAGPRQETAP